MNQKNTKLMFIIVGILIIIGAALFYVMNYTGFRVVKRDPSGGVPLSVSKITFTLSDVITDNKPNISIKPEAAGKFSVDKDTVVFTPSEPFIKDTNYIVTIDNVTINNTDKKHSTKTSFKATYVPYDKLSTEEKDFQKENTDPIYNRYPISQKVLPYVTASYKMEYRVPYGEKEKLIIFITPLIGQGTHETTDEFQARLVAIKDETLGYITSNGFSLDDYNIIFNDGFLDQFNIPVHEDVYATPPESALVP